MKSGLDQLSKYAEYHRDRRNIATHLIGVPMIVFAVIALLSRPSFDIAGLAISPAWIVLAISGVYYLMLDASLGLTLTIIMAAMTWAAGWVAGMSTAMWLITGIGMFVVGWVIQFIGHYYEGRKPAFVDDIIGLMIGPLFVWAEIAFALGLKQEMLKAIEARVGPTHIRDLSKAAM
jgi:uncharacterized membrane protein YGL010W